MPEMRLMCRICTSETKHIGSAIVLKKYNVGFYACSSCGFIQTEDPFWLEEAYSEPLMKNDIGLVRRNLDLSIVASLMISCLFDRSSRFLDFGGGNGMLVRMMRDRGYDFYWHDKYAKNVFAQGFSVKDKSRYELVTAFELLEHLPSPRETIKEMMNYSDSILFTTLLIPEPRRDLSDWWYFALEGGQHVSFYSVRSLELIADSVSLRFYTDGRSVHLLSKKNIPKGAFRILSSLRAAKTFGAFTRRPSLLEKDYFDLTGQRLS